MVKVMQLYGVVIFPCDMLYFVTVFIYCHNVLSRACKFLWCYVINVSIIDR